MRVELDRDSHIYRIDGRIVPSVTQIISDGKKNFYTLGSDERGHRVHASTILYDTDSSSTVDDYPEYLRGWVKAWASFRKESGFFPLHTEIIGCDHDGRYAGTIDRIGSIGKRKLTIDIKSGGKERKHKLQLAGYHGLEGVDEAGDLWTGANELAIVYIRNDGTYQFDRISEADRMNAVIEFKQRLSKMLGEAV